MRTHLTLQRAPLFRKRPSLIRSLWCGKVTGIREASTLRYEMWSRTPKPEWRSGAGLCRSLARGCTELEEQGLMLRTYRQMPRVTQSWCRPSSASLPSRKACDDHTVRLPLIAVATPPTGVSHGWKLSSQCRGPTICGEGHGIRSGFADIGYRARL